MVIIHLLWILWPWWNFFCLVTVVWTYSVPPHIQKTCSHQCDSLNQGVLHMQHWYMCTTGLGCLIPESFYFLWCGLGIAILASMLPCPPQWYCSLWFTGNTWWDQCWSLSFFLSIVILQLCNIECLHLHCLVLWKSCLCSTDPSLLVMIPSFLTPHQKNEFIHQFNPS